MMSRAPQDFWAGLVFEAAGLLVLVVAWNYPTGTASQMSYGYFPMLLGGALCAIGGVIVVRSFLSAGAPVPRMTLRPLLPLVAIVAFGALLKTAGLILASFALIVISVLGAERFRPLDILMLTLLLIPFNWFVFVWALGMPLPLLPWD
jgi:Tripartite tricarboxylate transporter TctB family